MKYPYLVNLFIIINMLLYSYLIIGSFNFSNFTIKSHDITFYSLFTNLTSCSNPYGLCLFNFIFFSNLDTP